MTPVNPLATFHQWLLTEKPHATPIRTILLHGDPEVFHEHLIEEIADYLNEYDDDDAGCWLAATRPLIEQVARDHNLRQLLDNPENSFDESSEVQKILTTLGQRGHVIFRDSSIRGQEISLPHAFHAGISDSQDHDAKCHLILNPTLMNPANLAHIIGDVFLEWLHQERVRPSPTSYQTVRSA